jgi:hypothetical protein
MAQQTQSDRSSPLELVIFDMDQVLCRYDRPLRLHHSASMRPNSAGSIAAAKQRGRHCERSKASEAKPHTPPHTEEEAAIISAVSKGGNKRGARFHPSRRGFGALLRMTVEFVAIPRQRA